MMTLMHSNVHRYGRIEIIKYALEAGQLTYLYCRLQKGASCQGGGPHDPDKASSVRRLSNRSPSIRSSPLGMMNR